MADPGVSHVLAGPFAELHDGNGQLIFSNDNWRDTQESEIIATGPAPTDDLESALIVTLAPGAYTNVAGGINGKFGIAFCRFTRWSCPSAS